MYKLYSNPNPPPDKGQVIGTPYDGVTLNACPAFRETLGGSHYCAISLTSEGKLADYAECDTARCPLLKGEKSLELF